MEYGAFNICEKLESINLEKVQEIPDYAFYNCKVVISQFSRNRNIQLS